MKIPRASNPLLQNESTVTTMLFDLESDSKQENPISNDVIEEKMIQLLKQEMKKNDAPIEQYERLGF